jgi:hypothetical protein
LVTAGLLTLSAFLVQPVHSADHRDSPAASLNSPGDITDVFAFVDPNDSSRLVVAMGVNSFAVPSVNGTYIFSPDLLYQFKFDNNGDAREDHVIQVVFRGTSPQQVTVLGPTRPRGSIGARNRLLNERSVRSVKGNTGVVIGDEDEVLVFAGLRDDPFVFDVAQFNNILGGTQDLFRQATLPVFGALRGRAANGGVSGFDSFGGFNATYIVVSFPKHLVRRSSSRIGIWATVSQPLRAKGGGDDDDDRPSQLYVQFERMGQQVFNTVFIPKELKDQFNADIPSNDVRRYSRFVPDALTTTANDGRGNTIAGRVAVLTTLTLHVPPNGAPLLLPSDFPNTNRNLLRVALLPDVLRLDLDRASNDLAIGQFGLQNGRRPGDDVADIGLQLLRQLADVNFPDALGIPGSGPPRAGALNFRNAPVDRRVFVVLQGTDWIKPDNELLQLSGSGNDSTLPDEFPYLAAPHPIP